MPNYLKLAGESALSVFGIRSQYEQPKYEVIEFVGAIEVRRYAPRFAAQVAVLVERAAEAEQGDLGRE